MPITVEFNYCGIHIVEDVILTHPTNAQLEKGQGTAQAFPGQTCVFAILQCVLSRCPIEMCPDLDEHETGV